jgi:hypothetical protein
MTTDRAVIHYGPGLEEEASRVAGLYPGAAARIEARLGLPVDFRPDIVILADRKDLEEAGLGGLMAAYAVPGRMLVVIDCPRANTQPAGMKGILVHELCHLALHRRIPGIPKWLDEGVSQWASEGAAELLSHRGSARLPWLALTGGLPALGSLERAFPDDERGLVLAYDMSRSIVDFMASRQGRDSIGNLLTALASGVAVDDAFLVAFGVSQRSLERLWSEPGEAGAVLGLVMQDITAFVFFVAALGTWPASPATGSGKGGSWSRTKNSRPGTAGPEPFNPEGPSTGRPFPSRISITSPSRGNCDVIVEQACLPQKVIRGRIALGVMGQNEPAPPDSPAMRAAWAAVRCEY